MSVLLQEGIKPFSYETNGANGNYLFLTSLFLITVMAFCAISIWQYLNPTKAIRLRFKPTYTEEPKVDETYVKHSLIIRCVFFTGNAGILLLY